MRGPGTIRVVVVVVFVSSIGTMSGQGIIRFVVVVLIVFVFFVQVLKVSLCISSIDIYRCLSVKIVAFDYSIFFSILLTHIGRSTGISNPA